MQTLGPHPGPRNGHQVIPGLLAFMVRSSALSQPEGPQGSGGGEGEAEALRGAQARQVSPTQYLEVGSAFCVPSPGPPPRPLRESGRESHAHLGKLRLEQRLELTRTALTLAQPLALGTGRLSRLISGSPRRLAGQEGDYGPGDRGGSEAQGREPRAEPATKQGQCPGKRVQGAKGLRVTADQSSFARRGHQCTFHLSDRISFFLPHLWGRLRNKSGTPVNSAWGWTPGEACCS